MNPHPLIRAMVCVPWPSNSQGHMPGQSNNDTGSCGPPKRIRQNQMKHVVKLETPQTSRSSNTWHIITLDHPLSSLDFATCARSERSTGASPYLEEAEATFINLLSK